MITGFLKPLQTEMTKPSLQRENQDVHARYFPVTSAYTEEQTGRSKHKVQRGSISITASHTGTGFLAAEY